MDDSWNKIYSNPINLYATYYTCALCVYTTLYIRCSLILIDSFAEILVSNLFFRKRRKQWRGTKEDVLFLFNFKFDVLRIVMLLVDWYSRLFIRSSSVKRYRNWIKRYSFNVPTNEYAIRYENSQDSIEHDGNSSSETAALTHDRGDEFDDP